MLVLTLFVLTSFVATSDGDSLAMLVHLPTSVTAHGLRDATRVVDMDEPRAGVSFFGAFRRINWINRVERAVAL